MTNAHKSNTLNFPVLTEEQSPPSLRSVDEINTWIEQDYEFLFDRKIYEREKARLSVNVPFRLK